MSLETVKRVVCDTCLRKGPEALESEDPVELALAENWVCNYDGEDCVCPDCSSNKISCEKCKHYERTTCANDLPLDCFEKR